MKNFIYLFMTIAVFTLGSCSKEDDSADDTETVDELTGESKTFTLSSVLDSNVNGTVIFKEHESGATTIEIHLDGTTSGTYPVHLHDGSFSEDGAIAIILNDVNGDTGVSTTTVARLDDGTPINYSALIAYDGYISVYKTQDFDGYLVRGDIGINQFTGESVTYDLSSLTEDAIEGTATIYKRVSGAVLIDIKLEGTAGTGLYPAHIHANSVEEGGDVVVTLEPVQQDTGRSITHVEMLDDETPVTYEDLLTYDGHINVHLSETDMETIISQGNIGANAITD